jgi:putative spermidine/putrescine transport system substrate-binding protein
MVQGTLASLLLGASAVIVPGRARAAERLVVVAFGGIMGHAKQRALYEPFTRETGIQVVAVPGPSLAKLKLQVQSVDRARERFAVRP